MLIQVTAVYSSVTRNLGMDQAWSWENAFYASCSSIHFNHFDFESWNRRIFVTIREFALLQSLKPVQHVFRIRPRVLTRSLTILTSWASCCIITRDDDFWKLLLPPPYLDNEPMYYFISLSFLHLISYSVLSWSASSLNLKVIDNAIVFFWQ